MYFTINLFFLIFCEIFNMKILFIILPILWGVSFPIFGMDETRLTFKNSKRCLHGGSIGGVGNFKIKLTHEKTFSKDGCLVVSKKDGHPTLSDGKSIRISVKPGFCSSDSGWDDCKNDRSRSEFYDSEGIKSQLSGTYEYSIFIPSNVNLLQNGRTFRSKGNTLFLGQLNTVTSSGHYSSPIMVKWFPHRGLGFQIHDNFNWNVSKTVYSHLGLEEQKDRWIGIKFNIDVYENEKGMLEIFVDNKKVFRRDNIPTIKKGGKVTLKLGIYNYLVSLMKEPRSEQYVYFDNIKKTIRKSISR
jgi:hypothetical protein